MSAIGLIRVCDGDMFESGADVLVNPVNCVGVSGKGLARVFKERFPGNERHYRERCRGGFVRVGTVSPYCVMGDGGIAECFVVNFPTKEHWRERSHLRFIESGMGSFVRWINTLVSDRGVFESRESNVLTIAVPALGCGEGGLLWENVFLMMVYQIILYSKGVDKMWWVDRNEWMEGERLVATKAWMEEKSWRERKVEKGDRMGERIVYGIPDVLISKRLYSKVCWNLYVPRV